MKVSKNKVTLLGAAVAALFASAASAQIILSSSAPTVTAVNGNVYARELASGTQLQAGGSTVNTILGIGMSSAQDRYLKFTLTGATFNSAVVNGNLTSPTVAGTVAIGGAAGSSSVIFQVTAAAGASINDATRLTMPTGFNIASSAGNATVTYEVYEFLNQATGATPITPLYTRTGTLASFTPAVVLTNPVAQNSTATALSSYLNFGALSAGINAAATRVNIGLVTLALPATIVAPPLSCGGAPCMADGTTAATIGTIVNTAVATSFALTGDFTAAASAASISTPNATEVGSAVSATSATLPLLPATVTATGFTGLAIRYLVNGTTAIPVSAYTAALTWTPLTGFTASVLGPITTGNIFRDGTQLDTPWVTATTGFISRFFLTQTTPSNLVPWTAVVRNPAGLVTGGTLSGILASNRVTNITLASLLPADTTAFPGPYQVTFNVATTDTSIQGSYVLTSPNGAVSNTPLNTLARQ